jgi:Xaa-Pro aminopeptidase
MSKEPNLAQLYSGRRQRLASQIDEGIAIINSAGMAPDPALFDKNLQYLTGLSSRKATLVLAPNGITVDRFDTLRGPELGRGRIVNEVLFVEERSEQKKIIDGEGVSFAELRESTGVEAVYDLSKMGEILGRALMKENVHELWLNTPGNPGFEGPLPPEIMNINQLRKRYYWLTPRNIAPKIHELRRVKDAYEVDCLRRAFAAHAKIFEKIMGALKPGENESLGQAIFDYETNVLPAEFASGLDLYASNIIVAAGANAAVAHYMDNNQEIMDGDLILIDSGVACNGYYSDITTTFPANGRFSPRQKELYAIVLEAQKRAIATMKPGSSALEAHRAVYDHFKANDLARYGYGNAGHPVGLNIHDANGDGDTPFEPGVVIVIEPFIAIPEEGIGIRIESGVLITEDGHQVLPEPPKEIDEVEAICRRD